MRRASRFLVFALVLSACGGGAAQTTAPPSPTTPAMQVMAEGQFVDVDGSATGKAELAVVGEVYEVVLEDFSIDSIEHTNVVLVANDSVTMSDDIDPAALLDLGPLKATSGMQVYPIPAEMAATVMDGYHSVVIWDTAMAHVIAAAALQ
jgi:hypothetical protein